MVAAISILPPTRIRQVQNGAYDQHIHHTTKAVLAAIQVYCYNCCLSSAFRLSPFVLEWCTIVLSTVNLSTIVSIIQEGHAGAAKNSQGIWVTAR